MPLSDILQHRPQSGDVRRVLQEPTAVRFKTLINYLTLTIIYVVFLQNHPSLLGSLSAKKVFHS